MVPSPSPRPHSHTAHAFFPAFISPAQRRFQAADCLQALPCPGGPRLSPLQIIPGVGAADPVLYFLEVVQLATLVMVGPQMGVGLSGREAFQRDPSPAPVLGGGVSYGRPQCYWGLSVCLSPCKKAAYLGDRTCRLAEWRTHWSLQYSPLTDQVAPAPDSDETLGGGLCPGSVKSYQKSKVALRPKGLDAPAVEYLASLTPFTGFGKKGQS